MTFVLLILSSFLSLAGYASPFSPPADASADEQASWAKARCKWRMVESPRLIGYEMDLHIKDLDRCFLEARLMMIMAAQDPESSADDRALFHRPWDVIWDSHASERKICRMIPLKRTYAAVSEDELKAALREENATALNKVAQVADENISIKCLAAQEH